VLFSQNEEALCSEILPLTSSAVCHVEPLLKFMLDHCLYAQSAPELRNVDIYSRRSSLAAKFSAMQFSNGKIAPQR